MKMCFSPEDFELNELRAKVEGLMRQFRILSDIGENCIRAKRSNHRLEYEPCIAQKYINASDCLWSIARMNLDYLHCDSVGFKQLKEQIDRSKHMECQRHILQWQKEFDKLQIDRKKAFDENECLKTQLRSKNEEALKAIENANALNAILLERNKELLSKITELRECDQFDNLKDKLISADNERQELNKENQFLSQQLNEIRLRNYKLEKQILELKETFLKKEEEFQTTCSSLRESIDGYATENEELRRKAENAGTNHNKTPNEEAGEISDMLSWVLEDIPKEAEEVLTPQDPYVIKSLEQIEKIHDDTTNLQQEVEEFFGTKENKNFLHLRELLIKNLVKLDNVETEGHLIIREKRREVIQFVQKVLDTLKGKVIE